MALTGNDIANALRAAGASTSGLVASTDKIADLFNDAMINYGVCTMFNDKYDVAALVSECMMESAYFRTTTEYTAGSNSYSPYDGRTFIQLTWSSNYKGFGSWCKSKGLVSSSDYFVNNPHQLSDLKWAALGGVYYFTQVMFHGKPLTDYSHNIDQVGKAVNLGDPYSSATPNGQAARRAAYNAVLAQGDHIVPDCSSTPDSQTAGDDDMAAAEHVKKHRQTDQKFKKADDYQWLKIDEDGADISFVTYPAKVIGGVLYLELDDLPENAIVSVYGGLYDMRNVKDGPNEWYPAMENNPDRIDGVKSGWVHESIPFAFNVSDQGKGWDYRALRWMIKSTNVKAVIKNVRAEAWVVKK